MQASASDLPRTTLTPADGHVDPPPAPPAPKPPTGVNARTWLAHRLPMAEDDHHPQAAHIGYLALMRCVEALERAQARVMASQSRDGGLDGQTAGLLAVSDQYRKLARTCGQHSMGVLAPPPTDDDRQQRR